MKLLFPMMLLALSLSAHADRFQSRIHSIDVGVKKGIPHLIKLENGRVVFVKWNDQETLKSFKSSWKAQDTLEIQVDEKFNFISAETEEERTYSHEGYATDEARMSYDPTTISETETSAVFKRMRRDYQNKSQCYNRAHIWAYEEYKKSGLNSMKLFLFFTSRYIRNYRYKWWFHVAPMVVSNLGDRVLDRRYTSGALFKDNWTKGFVHSGRKCPIVDKYSDYRNNQQSEDCYMIPVSMYFWQPRDIEKRDRTGAEKTSFIQSEVNHAYWEAF